MPPSGRDRSRRRANRGTIGSSEVLGLALRRGLALAAAGILLAACGGAHTTESAPTATATPPAPFVAARAPVCPALEHLGKGWQTESLPAGDTRVLALTATDPCHVWAGGTSASGGAFIVFSTSGGASWTVANLPPGYTAVRGLALADVKRGWAVAVTATAGAVLATTDGGADWTLAKSLPAAATLTGITTNGSQHVWAVGASKAGQGLIFASADGGRTWSAEPPPAGTPSLQAVVWAGGTSAWAAGVQGALVETSDGGLHWRAIPGTTLGTTITGLAASGGQAWAVGFLAADPNQRGVGLHRAGSLWLPVQLPPATGRLAGVAAADGGYAWAVGQGPDGSASILATSDGGTSWTQQAPNGAFALDAVAFANADAGWAGGSGGLLATVDGGAGR
jgi:photosystem II stability/assembly factor-like uncharacterized protein